MVTKKKEKNQEGNLYIFDIGFVANLKYIFKYKANINRLEIHSACLYMDCFMHYLQDPAVYPFSTLAMEALIPSY